MNESLVLCAQQREQKSRFWRTEEDCSKKFSFDF